MKKGVEMETQHIRMTPELKSILDRAAEKCGLDSAEVIRRTARMLKRIPDSVVRLRVQEMRYKDSGPVVVTVRNCPEIINSDRFRLLLYYRCRMELERDVPPMPDFSSCKGGTVNDLLNGRKLDYLVEGGVT